jgi:hypothetical protein
VLLLVFVSAAAAFDGCGGACLEVSRAVCLVVCLVLCLARGETLCAAAGGCTAAAAAAAAAEELERLEDDFFFDGRDDDVSLLDLRSFRSSSERDDELPPEDLRDRRVPELPRLPRPLLLDATKTPAVSSLRAASRSASRAAVRSDFVVRFFKRVLRGLEEPSAVLSL